MAKSQDVAISIRDLHQSIFEGTFSIGKTFKNGRCFKSYLDLCFDIALWTIHPINHKAIALHQQHLCTIAALIPKVVNAAYSHSIPHVVSECITQYLMYDGDMEIKWGMCGDNRSSDDLLEFSNSRHSIRFTDGVIKNRRGGTIVGGRDCVIVKSDDYFPIGMSVTVNCYVQSLGDEMWIGLMSEAGYHSNGSLRNNAYAVTVYNREGEVSCFGQNGGKLHRSYRSGDWLTFYVQINKKGILERFVVIKNGRKFVSPVPGKLKKRNMEKCFFVVEVDNDDDQVFIEALYPTTHDLY